MAVLEKYEWTDIWWDEPTEDGKRVLMLGDSITRGMKEFVKENVGDVFIDMLATSRSVDNPNFMRELKYMVEQSKYDLICVSHGLHGFHLEIDGYEKGMTECFEYLKNQNTKIAVETLTPVTMPGGGYNDHTERGPIVHERNEVLKKLAEKFEFPIIDSYGLVEGKAEIRHIDGVHYNQDGYKFLGDFLAKNILEKLG